jgi:hypothetical protein
MHGTINIKFEILCMFTCCKEFSFHKSISLFGCHLCNLEDTYLSFGRNCSTRLLVKNALCRKEKSGYKIVGAAIKELKFE